MPSEVDRVAKNRTKYISEVSFERVAASILPEDWFSGSLPVNPGLVGVIGNKGSGKTALAETWGLIGNCELEPEYSFLNEEKFRQPRNNKAKHFRAFLTWASGHKESKLLSDSTDRSKPTAVSYIPQNYLEKICNEVSNLPGSRFDLELKSVIFSHVSEDKMLGASSLDELLQFKTAPLLERLKQLRSELNVVNAEIVSLEEQGSSEQRQLLLNLRASKERELEEHEKVKPAGVARPETDLGKKAEMDALSKEISAKNTDRDELVKKIKDAETAKRNATLRVAIANRVLSGADNFKAQHETFIRNILKDCAALGVDPRTIVTLGLHLKDIEAIKTSAEAISAEQEGLMERLNQDLTDLKRQVEDLTEKLDAPTSAHQAYLEALRQWQAKREKIIGDEQRSDTLTNVKKRISDLAAIPQLVSDAEAGREAKVREIFGQIREWVEAYRHSTAAHTKAWIEDELDTRLTSYKKLGRQAITQRALDNGFKWTARAVRNALADHVRSLYRGLGQRGRPSKPRVRKTDDGEFLRTLMQVQRERFVAALGEELWRLLVVLADSVPLAATRRGWKSAATRIIATHRGVSHQQARSDKRTIVSLAEGEPQIEAAVHAILSGAFVSRDKSANRFMVNSNTQAQAPLA